MTRLTTRTDKGALQDEDVLSGTTEASETDYCLVIAGAGGKAYACKLPHGPGKYGTAIAGREGTAYSLVEGLAAAGHDGFASSGAGGVATVPNRTQLDAGPTHPTAKAWASGADGAVAIAGEGAFASVANSGVAFARADGCVMGLRGSLLIGVRRAPHLFVVGQVLPLKNQGDQPVPGVQPLNEGIWYKVDSSGKFVPV